GSYRPAADSYHQWRKGCTGNLLTPWGNERISVELYGPSAAAYELSVHEASTGEEVGRASARSVMNGAGEICAVRFTPILYHKYLVKVRAQGTIVAPAAGPFHLVVLGGGLSHWTSKGSIACPADGQAVQAVGAVDADGRRHFYSSCGPNSKLPKPDFVAEVPFPSLWRERPFAGTSAAAPQAAGLAALWWSRNPEWNAEQVSSAMRAAARDLGPPGHDCETGYGCIALP
ncbi:MAG TPA: S8 family serine peptidase, partial [Gemmataceae bacterium]|nr:S8 family serine peptidase [Gemmataceae bacterium]